MHTRSRRLAPQAAAVWFLVTGAVAAPSAWGQGTPAGTTALDTMIRPGHRDYARYTTPGMCLQAVTSITTLAGRAIVDTTRAHATSSEREPLPDSAVAAARACGGRFAPATTPTAELLNLAALAFAANEDARAMAAADRWLATTAHRDGTGRAWALVDVFNVLRATRPIRLVAIDTIFTRLAALGPAAALPRVYVAQWMLEGAERRFDAADMERRGFEVFSALARLTPRERDGHGHVNMDRHLENQYGTFDPAGYALSRATAARAPARLAGLPDTIRVRTGVTWSSQEGNINALLQMFTAPARVAPLQAAYWFGAQGEHRFPVPGRASIFLPEDEALETSYRTFAMLQRLHNKYSNALNITLVYKTKGYFRDGPPLAPAAEAEAVRAFYLDYLKLPVNVAVAVSPMTQLPDGRRIPKSPAYEHQDGYYIPAGMRPGAPEGTYTILIVDPNGQSVFRSWTGLDNEGEVEAYIDRALGRQQAATGATNGGGATGR